MRTLVMLVSAPMLMAQGLQYNVDRVTTKSGRAQSSIYSIMQDRYGYIWFGTNNGLERYDGYALHPMHYSATDTSGLSGFVVTAICEDSSGYIWAGTRASGLNRMDRRTKRIQHYRHDPRNPATISSDQITGLATARNGDVWVTTILGLDRFDHHTGKITRYATNVIPTSVYVDRRGNTWVIMRSVDHSQRTFAQPSSIGRFDPASNSFRTWPIGQPDQMYRIIGEQNNGCIDISAGRGVGYNSSPIGGPLLFRFDPSTGTTQEIGIMNGPDPGHRWQAMSLEPSGLCLFIVDPIRNAVSKWDASLKVDVMMAPTTTTTSRRSVSDSDMPPPLLKINGVHVAYRDRSGITWLGTDNGLFRISLTGTSFSTARSDPDNSASLSTPRLRSIHVDDQGAVWAGTDHGLNRRGPMTRSWEQIYASRSASSGLPNATVNVIYRDTDGVLLFGTRAGIGRYDPGRKRFLKPWTGPWQDRHVWSFVRDRDQTLWVGANPILYSWNARTGKIREFLSDPTDSTTVLPGGIWSMLEDRHGNVWVGTDGGLCRWLPNQQRFKRYKSDKDDMRALPAKPVWALYEDRQGDLWVSTFGGGISKYEPATDDFTSITMQNGLIDNAVNGLLEDHEGVFWISTIRGLVRWDRQKNDFRLYNADDGLDIGELTFKAFAIGRDGTLHFGGSTGMASFRPSRLRGNPSPPPITITAFRVFDSLVAGELFNGDTVRLERGQNFFSFEFSALNYINSRKNEFAYRLEGVDPEWVHTNSEHRLAGYTHLDPGTYTFVVRGSNNDGVWNNDGIRVTVIIEPPWWDLMAFRLLSAATLVALVFGGFAVRANGIRRHEREMRISALQATLESQEHERQRIAQDLHDGIGQLLAAAAINLGRLRGMQDVESMQDPLERSSWILHRAIDDVRALSHALGTSTLQELGLVAALDELLANIESHERTRIDFVTVGMEERLPESVEIGLFRISQELISNVLRHSEATEASIQIMRLGREVRLTIEDNGIGFDVAATSSGMGRRNIAARVSTMGGEVQYDAEYGKGATVTVVINLPTTKTHGLP